MGKDSKIEWCHHTFNPWWGCEKVSPACAHCYAETWAKRCGADVWGAKAERRVFGVKHWNEPLRWNKLAAKQRVISNGQVLSQWGTCETAGEPESLRVQFDFDDGFTGEMRPEEWEALKPFRPRVFCASMADVFEDRPELMLERLRLLKLIFDTPNLDWLLLTKRPGNVMRMLGDCLGVLWLGMTEANSPFSNWLDGWHLGRAPENVWMGTTVEDQVRAEERVPVLLGIPAKVRFLSCEPLLGPVLLDNSVTSWLSCTSAQGEPEVQQGTDVDCCESFSDHGDHFHGIDWVIAGGESGPQARPMDAEWARSLRDQCVEAKVPFLFKQWGEWAPGHDAKRPSVVTKPGEILTRFGKKAAGRRLDGVEWDEFPVLT